VLLMPESSMRKFASLSNPRFVDGTFLDNPRFVEDVWLYNSAGLEYDAADLDTRAEAFPAQSPPRHPGWSPTELPAVLNILDTAPSSVLAPHRAHAAGLSGLGHDGT
jgi:hypothetical protein